MSLVEAPCHTNRVTSRSRSFGSYAALSGEVMRAVRRFDDERDPTVCAGQQGCPVQHHLLAGTREDTSHGRITCAVTLSDRTKGLGGDREHCRRQPVCFGGRELGRPLFGAWRAGLDLPVGGQNKEARCLRTLRIGCLPEQQRSPCPLGQVAAACRMNCLSAALEPLANDRGRR